MPWVAVIGSLAGAAIAADSASNAADAQQQASGQALGVTQAQYNQNRADNTPYRQTGVNALNRMLAAMGLPTQQQAPTLASNGLPQASAQQALDYQSIRNGLQDKYLIPGTGPQPEAELRTQQYDEAGLAQAIQAEVSKRTAANAAATAQPAAAPAQPTDMASLMGMDPGYQFRQSEGAKGVERSAAARGGLFSGRAAKDLTRFNQGLASSEFGNAWNRLSGLAGIGQNATNSDMAQSTNFANSSANLITGSGNARASGYVGAGNAINSGIGNGISQYQNAQYLNALRQPTTSQTYAPYQYGGSYNPEN